MVDAVRDVAGTRWLVSEARATGHGFDLLLGRPVVTGEMRRGAAVIVTPALAAYLRHTRLREVSLPVARSAIVAIRRRLDIAWSWDAWWREREEDLRTMTLEVFAMRHGCSQGAASQRRAQLARSGAVGPKKSARG